MASNPTTATTVTRKPRMHGFPPITAGLCVIRANFTAISLDGLTTFPHETGPAPIPARPMASKPATWASRLEIRRGRAYASSRIITSMGQPTYFSARGNRAASSASGACSPTCPRRNPAPTAAMRKSLNWCG